MKNKTYRLMDISNKRIIIFGDGIFDETSIYEAQKKIPPRVKAQETILP
jgi:hypothetical protein